MLKNVLDLNITALTFWCFGYGFGFGNVNGGIIGSKYFMG
jgi:ammonia channel protein AmtB